MIQFFSKFKKTYAVYALLLLVALFSAYALSRTVLEPVTTATNLPKNTAILPVEQSTQPLADQESDMKLGIEKPEKKATSGIKTSGVELLSPVVSGTKYKVATVSATAPCNISLDYSVSQNQNQITSVLTSTNTGNGVCDQASLTIYYADTEKFISSNPNPSASNYYWKLGNIESLEQKTITIATQGTSALPTDTEACVTAYNGSDDCRRGSLAGTSTPPPVAPTPPPAPQPTPPPPAKSPSARPVPDGMEYGVWVWDDVSNMGNTQMVNLLDKVEANGFNVVYLTVDPYLNMSTVQKDTYTGKLVQFLTYAQERGIEVDAEAGWKDWINGTSRKKPITILNFVASFNASQNIDFRGVQYDIEPYLLSNYEKNKAAVLTSFVALVAEIVDANKNAGQRLSFVIPHFYDCMQAWTPNVTYKGKSDCTYNHLLNILDASANSDIIIMAYRNFASGNNGVIQISQEELRQSTGHSTQILIAQETGDINPDYVTYFGTSREYLFSEIGTITNTFSGYSNFGGISIHYLDPFLELQ